MPPKKTPSKKKSGTTTKRKKRTESFSMYIYKVLKQVHPDTGVSKKAMSIMNPALWKNRKNSRETSPACVRRRGVQCELLCCSAPGPLASSLERKPADRL
jgi:hypothetical protein